MRTKADCAVKSLPSPVVTAWTTRGFLAAIATHIIRFARAINNRIAINSLSQMDERLLKDIGVSRHDVDRALGAAIGDDPSHELMRSAVANAKLRFRRHQ